MNTYKAHIFKHRQVGEREEVGLKLFMPDGTPINLNDLSSEEIHNWAVIRMNNPSIHLTPGGVDSINTKYFYQVGDEVLAEQSNEDFYFGSNNSEFGPPGSVALFSAAGGRFQTTLMVANPSNTLDEEFTHQRYLWAGTVVGEESGEITGVGVDVVRPIFPETLENSNIASTWTSSIGYTPPGGMVLQWVGVALLGGMGTDDVSIDGTMASIAVWQI